MYMYYSAGCVPAFSFTASRPTAGFAASCKAHFPTAFSSGQVGAIPQPRRSRRLACCLRCCLVRLPLRLLLGLAHNAAARSPASSQRQSVALSLVHLRLPCCIPLHLSLCSLGLLLGLPLDRLRQGFGPHLRSHLGFVGSLFLHLFLQSRSLPGLSPGPRAGIPLRRRSGSLCGLVLLALALRSLAVAGLAQEQVGEGRQGRGRRGPLEAERAARREQQQTRRVLSRHLKPE